MTHLQIMPPTAIEDDTAKMVIIQSKAITLPLGELAAVRIGVKRFLRLLVEVAIEKGVVAKNGTIDFKMSQAEMGDRMGVCRDTVVNYLREAEQICKGGLVQRHNNGWTMWKMETGKYERKFLLNGYTITPTLLALYEAELKYIAYRTKRPKGEKRQATSIECRENPTEGSVGKKRSLLFSSLYSYKKKRRIRTKEKKRHFINRSFLEVPSNWIDGKPVFIGDEKKLFPPLVTDNHCPAAMSDNVQPDDLRGGENCDIIANTGLSEHAKQVLALQKAISELPEQARRQRERKQILRQYVLGELCHRQGESPKLLLQVVNECEQGRPEDTRKFVDNRFRQIKKEWEINEAKKEKGLRESGNFLAKAAQHQAENEELREKIAAGTMKPYGLLDRVKAIRRGEQVDLGWEK